MSYRPVIFWFLLTCFFIPFRLWAAEFRIIDSRSGQSRALTIYPETASNYFDLGELALAIGADLRWETTGQRIALGVDDRLFVFEDLLTFFNAGDETFQFVAPCLVVRGTFLVPAQFVLEYLPRILPGRFVFDKVSGELSDQGQRQSGSSTAPARTEPQPSPVKTAAGIPARSTERQSGLDNKAQSYRINTVMIDPGHGGRDPGALGSRYRLREKEIVLDIARRVVAKLKSSGLGLRVMISRDSDTFVPLQKRGESANMSNAGLFVSIHCNANRKSSVRGTSTYFLDAAKTDEERATAMLENAALKHEVEAESAEGKDDINLILQDMAQNEFLRESKDLSAFIHRELVRVLDLPDRGIKQANFAVLRGAYMPAALIETAYISNPQDEGLLRDSAFRERLAGAVADGIIKYIEQYHRKLSGG